MARLSNAGIAAALSMTLGACMVAPGMRMSTSSTGASSAVTQTAQQSGATEAAASGTAPSGAPASAQASAATQKVDATQATPEVPITELDIAVVKRLREERLTAQHQQVKVLSDVPQPYVIGAGDVLQIVVWDHPELAAASGAAPAQSQTRPADPGAGFVVDQSGDITFPYAGTIHVAGVRPEEVQRRITSALGKYAVFDIGGELQAPSFPIPGDDFAKSRFVNRHAAVIEQVDFLMVDVEAKDVIAQLRQARPRDEPNVTGTDDSDFHEFVRLE
jgi:polysaccharide biosynthesis/export protein